MIECILMSVLFMGQTAPSDISVAMPDRAPAAGAISPVTEGAYSFASFADPYSPFAEATDTCNCGTVGTCWFAGADYRVIRTHFSEAVAFATLTASLTPLGPDFRVTTTELDFDYQSSFSVFAGLHLSDRADVRLSYWYLDTDTGASGAALPGQVIVDPFGNLAPVGTTIETQAGVQLHVVDLEYIRQIVDPCSRAGLAY